METIILCITIVILSIGIVISNYRYNKKEVDYLNALNKQYREAKEKIENRDKFIDGQVAKIKAYEKKIKAIEDIELSKTTLPEKEDKIKEILFGKQ